MCFEGATGIADLAVRFPGLFVSVPYQDCAAAAEILRKIDIAQVDEKTRAEYGSWSRFQVYADKVGDVVDGAVHKRHEAERAAVALVDGDLDPSLFQSSAPEWLKEGSWGVAATLPALAEIAVRLDQHGFDGTLLQPGRLTGRKGSVERYRHVDLGTPDPARATLPCLAVVRNMTDVEHVAKVLFDTPNHAAVATLVIPDSRRGHESLIDGARSLRAGTVVHDAASIAAVLGSASPIHVWLASGDTSTGAALRCWEQAAFASFSGHGGVDALLVEADPFASRIYAGAREKPAKRLAGLPAFLVDDHHLWLGKSSEPDIARWLAEPDLFDAPNAAVLQALLNAVPIADGAVAVVARSPRRRTPYGNLLLGRDSATRAGDRVKPVGSG